MSPLRATVERRRIWIFRLSPTSINKRTKPKRVQYRRVICELSRVIYRIIDEYLASIYQRSYFATYTLYERLSEYGLYTNLLFLNIFDGFNNEQ